MEIILDHYRNPRNFGKIENADISYEEGNPSCGDIIRIDMKIKNNVIEDIKFSGKGCTISQASASILTEMVTGKNLEEVKKFDKNEMLEAIGVPISMIRVKCALLGLKVLKSGAYGIKTWPGEEE
jgi:nitrogen fixation NifU-like protein